MKYGCILPFIVAGSLSTNHLHPQLNHVINAITLVQSRNLFFTVAVVLVVPEVVHEVKGDGAVAVGNVGVIAGNLGK